MRYHSRTHTQAQRDDDDDEIRYFVNLKRSNTYIVIHAQYFLDTTPIREPPSAVVSSSCKQSEWGRMNEWKDGNGKLETREKCVQCAHA